MLKAQSPKPPPGQLILRVKQARRLPAMDYNGLVDAFVEVIGGSWDELAGAIYFLWHHPKSSN